MGGLKSKGGKKNRKYGNNIAGALIYKNENRKVRNKKARLIRHLKHFINDLQAAAAYKRHTGGEYVQHA